LSLKEVRLHPVQNGEEQHYQALMQRHHYLGALPKIGETLWYVATWHGQWVALVSFSAAALEVRRSGSVDRLGFPPPI